LWTTFGVGVAVTSFRGWFGPQSSAPSTAESPSPLRGEPEARSGVDSDHPLVRQASS
jgi:hypothetical protein